MFYGIILSIIIGVFSKFVSDNFLDVGSVTIAVITGIIVRNFVLKKHSYGEGTNLLEKKFLPVAIMFLGTELNFGILLKLGYKSIIFILLMIFSTILFGYLTAKVFNFGDRFGLLLGTGNAVCGSSAIAATAPILESDEESIAFSVAAVNLMGSFGIFFMPAIAKALHFSDIQSGVLVGGTLQAVGQVVAAGFSVNSTVGNLAVVIKMGRVLCLGLVIIILDYIVSRKSSENKEKKKKVTIPYFIVGFFIFSVIASVNILPQNILGMITKLGKWILLVAMAAIGLKINFKSLIEKGKNLIFMELIIEMLQIVTAVSLIKIFY